MRATESDPRVTELYNESTPFLDAYPDYDLALLPAWVRENIEAARVYGGSKRGVVLPDGRKYHLDNKLNDLTGREWTFFINSVFSTHYPTRGEEAYAHHIRKIHPTPKPPQLMRDLIRFFSKEGDLGNMGRAEFLEALKCSIEKTLPYIKFRGYIVVFIKDLQPSKKETNLLHAEVIDRINEIPNVYYKGMKIST